MQPKISISFRDKKLEQDFRIDGFVVLNLSDSKTTEHLEEYITSLKPEFGSQFYYSLMAHNYEQNKSIGSKITALLSSELNLIFDDFIIRNPSFIAKPGNTTDEMLLHQDWSFTDVDRFEIGTLWIPLCDVNRKNGGLIFLPGSQHVFSNYVSSSIQTLRISSASFPEQLLRFPEVKTGQAVVFNPSVFHGSCPNYTDQVRIAVTINIFPKDAPFVYYERISENKIGKIILSDDEFLKQLNTLAINASQFNVLGDIIYSANQTTEVKLIERYSKYV
jgi:ectoine hydroxylase-related dioxygenase (phytanoyl-CoA dioxygenase family)